MKYIIVDEIFAVMFPANIFHVDASRLLTGREFRDIKVTGAGYVSADSEGRLYVHGRSDGLNIDAKPEDLEVIMGSLQGKFIQGAKA